MPSVFVPKETVKGETRVAASPDTIRRLVKLGFSVAVESGAGAESKMSDEAFVEAGARIEKSAMSGYGAADLVLKLHPFSSQEAGYLKEKAVTISYLWLMQNKESTRSLAAKSVSAFAMDLLPRISRAQSMDALSSQANLAGYKAVILAADYLPNIFPLMTTAAGTIKPAKIVIMGAGVAGLQAIATAKRLGAVVEVSDVRPAVKEQVESLGGRFIMVEGMDKMQDAGGYAKEASPEFLQKQKDLIRKHIEAADVVITTALVPGKPAPKLVTADMVKAMREGAVIVDLAAEQGGNCELTEAGVVAKKHGVTIVGLLNLAGLLPINASQVYAKNVLAVVQHLYPKGELALDFADEINAASFVTHEGKIRRADLAEAIGKGN